ncbi:MAG: hypothetical protein U0325_36760, partial [Polyangiales bacterium]
MSRDAVSDTNEARRAPRGRGHVRCEVVDVSPGAPTGVRRFALLASRDAVHPADETFTRRMNRDRAVMVSGIFREVDVVQRDRPAEIVEVDGAVGEWGDCQCAPLGAMVVLDTARRALAEEHMAQRGDGLVTTSKRRTLVCARAARDGPLPTEARTPRWVSRAAKLRRARVTRE